MNSPRCRSPFSPDRKSTRLNSSHVRISYAVFCLKKNKYRGSAVSLGFAAVLLTWDHSRRWRLSPPLIMPVVRHGKSSQIPQAQSLLFNDTAPTEIYPLSLHDALPI